MDAKVFVEKTFTEVANLKLASGNYFGYTEITVQFGQGSNRCPHQVRLWTHVPPINVINDLDDLGMADDLMFASRCTRNITMGSISISQFIQHEMSPHARMTEHTYTNLPEMFAALEKACVDPMATSVTTNQVYSGRSDIVIVHQTAAHYVTQALINTLVETTPDFPLLIVLVSKMGSKMMDDSAALTTPPGSAVTLIVEPIVASGTALGISLVSLLRKLTAVMPEEFASCGPPKENLRVYGPDTATVYTKKPSGWTAMTTGTHAAVAIELFTPYNFMLMNCTADDPITFSYSSNMTVVTSVVTDTSAINRRLLTDVCTDKSESRFCVLDSLHKMLIADNSHTKLDLQAILPYHSMRRQLYALRFNEDDESAPIIKCLEAAVAALWPVVQKYSPLFTDAGVADLYAKLKEVERITSRSMEANFMMGVSPLNRLIDYIESYYDDCSRQPTLYLSNLYMHPLAVSTLSPQQHALLPGMPRQHSKAAAYALQ